MPQPNYPKLTKRKLRKFHWSAWFPYPISWLRALILVPIAFPGARLIFMIFAGAILAAIRNSPVLSIFFFLLLGLLIPAITLSLPYHFFWFIWKKTSSNRWFKWLPSWSSLWEGFYAAVVIGLSFLSILAISTGLWFLSCKLSYETAEEISGCVGRATGRAARAIFGNTDNIWDFNGSGVITGDRDDFAVKPWFIVWLIIAAYFYQVEYLVRQHLISRLKIVFKKFKPVRKAFEVNDSNVEINRLRGEMGITQMKATDKSSPTSKTDLMKQQKPWKL